MKKGVTLIIALFSCVVIASTGIPGVKKLKEKEDGTYKVKCLTA